MSLLLLSVLHTSLNLNTFLDKRPSYATLVAMLVAWLHQPRPVYTFRLNIVGVVLLAVTRVHTVYASPCCSGELYDNSHGLFELFNTQCT